MFTGKKPWHPDSDKVVMFKVHLAEKKQLKPTYPNEISGEAIDFLDRCLEFNPDKRPSAEQLLDHNFVKVCSEEQYNSI